MVKVNITTKAMERLKREGVRSLKLKVIEETYEWTPCCGIGDACVTVPRVEVKEDEVGRGDVEFEVEGVTVYVEPDLLSGIEGELTIDADEFKGLSVKGWRGRSHFTINGQRFEGC